MSIIRNLSGGGLIFFCPGCKSTHQINSSRTGPIWTYNGNPDRPTFSPSVLYRSGHYVPGYEGKPCWCTFGQRFGRKPPEFARCGVCHSYIREGQIQFLGDCTHELAGKTVQLPDWPYAPGTYGGI